MTAGDVSVVVAAAALAISLSTFLTNRWRDRRDLFLQLHQHLVTAEQQRARRLVYQLAEQGKRVEDYTDEEYTLVNNALAALNSLGIYYKRRYIVRRDALEFWAEPLLRLMAAAEPFLAHRDSFVQGGRIWPELRVLAADAERFLGRQHRATQEALRATGRPWQTLDHDLCRSSRQIRRQDALPPMRPKRDQAP